MGSEIDIRPVLESVHQTGGVCLLPAVEARHSTLSFRHWVPGDDLSVSAFGVAEPTGDKAIGVPEILMVPLLAFDGDGYRLGYGGGYYDRTLAELRKQGACRAVGVAYAGQQVDTLPCDGFDQRLDYIVTEQGVVDFRT